MNAEFLIERAIAQRTAAGFSLKAWGAEGYTQARPFTYHATSADQRDRRRLQLEAKGFTVEGI